MLGHAPRQRGTEPLHPAMRPCRLRLKTKIKIKLDRGLINKAIFDTNLLSFYADLLLRSGLVPWPRQSFSRYPIPLLLMPNKDICNQMMLSGKSSSLHIPWRDSNLLCCR